MIEVGDDAPSPPLRVISALLHCFHVRYRTICFFASAILANIGDAIQGRAKTELA
jgi:hypothetical protein